MKFASAFPFRHLAIAAVVLLSFGTVTALGAKSWAGFYYALIGPFAGGASRDWQSCCAEFSMTVFMVSGPVLLVGFLFQLIPQLQGGKGVLRFLVWGVAWRGCVGACPLGFPLGTPRASASLSCTQELVQACLARRS